MILIFGFKLEQF